MSSKVYYIVYSGSGPAIDVERFVDAPLAADVVERPLPDGFSVQTQISIAIPEEREHCSAPSFESEQLNIQSSDTFFQITLQ